MPKTPCRIDPATPADIPEILALIRELAEFEHLAHEAQASAEDLTSALFSPRPYAEVLMARGEGRVSGFALFFHNYSTFKGKPGLYLEDLYVRPAFRGQGHGKALLTRVAQLAVER